MAPATFAEARQAPTGNPPARGLRDGHDIGDDIVPLVRKQFPRAPHSRLDFVVEQENSRGIRDSAECLEVAWRHGVNAAFALNGFDKYRRRLVRNGPFHRLQIPKRNLVEAIDQRTEPGKVLLLAAGGELCQRPSVKRALYRDDPPPPRVAFLVMESTNGLEAGFHGLGTRIAEEHGVREGIRRQLRSYPFLLRDAVKVRNVPKPLGLAFHCLHHSRMAVAEGVDGNSRGKIEIPPPIGVEQISSFAALEGDVIAGVSRIERCIHGSWPMHRARIRSGDGRRKAGSMVMAPYGVNARNPDSDGAGRSAE